MTEHEAFVLERVQEGAAIIGLYPATEQVNLDAFEQWLKARGTASQT